MVLIKPMENVENDNDTYYNAIIAWAKRMDRRETDALIITLMMVSGLVLPVADEGIYM